MGSWPGDRRVLDFDAGAAGGADLTAVATWAVSVATAGRPVRPGELPVGGPSLTVP